MRNDAAIKYLYEHYYNNLFRIAERKTHDRKASEDIAQEALIKVLNGWDVSHSLDEKRCIPLKSSTIRFTNRERELIELLARGFTSQDVSTSLGLTLRTVETYRSRLLQKAKVRNTSELLRYVHRIGIICSEITMKESKIRSPVSSGAPDIRHNYPLRRADTVSFLVSFNRAFGLRLR